MDIYPLKSQYGIFDKVIIHMDLDDSSEKNITLYVTKEEHILFEMMFETDSTTRDVELSDLYRETGGFGVVAKIRREDGQIVHLETAFDIVTKPNCILRYGFLSDFDGTDKENLDLDWLRKCHINMIQFYDWSYRPNHVVSEDDEYADLMGKHIKKSVVLDKINTAKKYGMKSTAYIAVYAASEHYAKNHPKEILLNSAKKPFVFIKTFHIMDISIGSSWRNHIISEFENAVSKMHFDGIHMDTYGFPKTAYSCVDGNLKRVCLENEFETLINDTYESVSRIHKNPCLVFNNVGNWPVKKTASSDVAAVYIEVWPPYDRYFHIAELIKDAKEYSNNSKTVILAAYLKTFREGNRDKAIYSALILTAAIASMGADHLLLGEEGAVLTQGYYSDYTKLTSKEMERIRRYYDFLVQYEGLLYSFFLEDVSMTHIGWDNYEYKCLSHEVSSSGESGKIWTIIRESSHLKIISLINLCNQTNDYWNMDKEEPICVKDITFQVSVDYDVLGIYVASPDCKSLKPTKIEFKEVENDKGRFVEFTVSELKIWSLVYIRLGEETLKFC
ncbi:MAG: glycoside hydrolase family 66 protein [Lachnospiraceae bacterium]|nr:glycoside hydrolase family 66 protein [Lachnospiraceae bacterium]